MTGDNRQAETDDRRTSPDTDIRAVTFRTFYRWTRRVGRGPPGGEEARELFVHDLKLAADTALQDKSDN
jgi:hypothetical protein